MTKVLMFGALCCGLSSFAQSVSYSYDAAGRLVGVAYPNGKRISMVYDPAGNLLRRLVSSSVAGATPVATAAGVVNAASFAGGPIAPGELITIFGTGIGPATLANYQLVGNLFSSFVGETNVSFDGVPAPLVYASAGQVAALVPYSVAGQLTTQMVITVQGRSSAPVTIPVTAAAPALFSANQSGKGNGAILNQDNSVNGLGNAAAKGSVVVLYGTGEGQTTPGGVNGLVATTVFPKPIAPVTVTIGGINAEVLYAGAAPFLVAGVFQINVKVPEGVASGAVPVIVRVGSAASQDGLTVSVQ